MGGEGWAGGEMMLERNVFGKRGRITTWRKAQS